MNRDKTSDQIKINKIIMSWLVLYDTIIISEEPEFR